MKDRNNMTVDLRTRVELSCWNIIIPMMMKLRNIRSQAQPTPKSPLSCRQFVMQVLVWSAIGLLVGFGISSIHAFLW
jgi:hypothetical protein